LKQIKYFTIIGLAVLCSGFFNQLEAQKHEQVLVANGGYYGMYLNNITVGAYDPVSKKYANFDTFPGNSPKEFLLEYNTAYLATDERIVKYNLDNNTRIGMSSSWKKGGIRRLAFYGLYIVATTNVNNYIAIFKKSDLSLVNASRLQSAAEGITIVGDTAYLTMGFSFSGDTGKIGVYDLKNMQYNRTILLDNAARGISKMYNDGKKVIGVSEYPNARIIEYDVQSGKFTIINPGTSMSGTFDLRNQLLYSNFGDGIGTFNTSTGAVTHSLVPFVYYDGAAYDTLSKGYYYTSLSYASPGTGYRTNASGKVIDSFGIGVAPKAVAIDYHTLAGIKEPPITQISFGLYPNPANNLLNIQLPHTEEFNVVIYDMTGRELLQISQAQGNMSLPLESLEKGVYIIKVQSESSTGFRKFIKE
jgi:hypothetical protein